VRSSVVSSITEVNSIPPTPTTPNMAVLLSAAVAFLVLPTAIAFPGEAWGGGTREEESRTAVNSGGLLQGTFNRFELHQAQPHHTNASRLLGFCGNLRLDSWQGRRWPALVVLAKIAAQQGILPMTKRRWRVAFGADDQQEVEEAVRLLTGSWQDKAWQQPVDALIGCGSTATTERVASVATGTQTPQISSNAWSAELQTSDKYPNFFRMVPTDIDVAMGFLHVCRHFGWQKVGLLYEGDERVREVADASAQLDAWQFPTIEGFLLSGSQRPLAQLERARDSRLRVFGLTYTDVARGRAILHEAAGIGMQSRLFITAHADALAVSTADEQLSWNGMLVIDFMDHSCCTSLAKQLEAIWHRLSFQTLVDHAVPEKVVRLMEVAHPDLFQQNPWHARGSFFFDSIIAALMAFEGVDFSIPESANGKYVHAGQSVTSILQRTSFAGVSGWVNLSTAEKTSDRQQPRLALSQVQHGQIKRVGNVNLPTVEVTRPLLFPGEISNPRAFDIVSDSPGSIWLGSLSEGLQAFRDRPEKMVVVLAALILVALSCTLGALLWRCVGSKSLASNGVRSGARVVTFSKMATGAEKTENEEPTQEVLVPAF